MLNRRCYLIEHAAQNRFVPPLIPDADKIETVACLPVYSGDTPLASLILVTRIPRTLGSSFVHINDIDMLVPFDEEVIEIPVPEPDETLRLIGQNIARLVEDDSTIECGIGQIPQALAEYLHDKKDLGVHTEMFSDWIIDLVECGAITCAKKTINRGKIVGSFVLGTQKLYDFIDDNPLIEFRPTHYVNDPFVIAKNAKMISINSGIAQWG